jgi:hypothetical protein
MALTLWVAASEMLRLDETHSSYGAWPTPLTSYTLLPVA